MQEVKKSEKIVWEVEPPEEVRMNYREWVKNPFPIIVERVTRISNGNVAVVGRDSSDNSNTIYIVFFPSSIHIPTIVENTIMTIMENKIVFISENTENDETPF
jgi:hypothetical protein